MIVTLASVAAPNRAEAVESERAADPTTFTQWEQGIGDPTDPRSTGRVWTDKSVSTDAVELKTYLGETVQVTPEHEDAFLVGLSAMSSAQQLTGVANVTKPLDIVLVLDTSGSMAWNMDGETNTYYPIYSSDPGYSEGSDRYSILVDGAYQHIRHFPSPYGWGYYPNNVQDPTKPNYGWKTVVPKTSASDRGRNHVQFYEHGPIAEKDTRLHALKQAVHGFIDRTIADTGGQKNRVGLVAYASEATVNSGLTDDPASLKTVVDELTATGATRADLGMEQAKGVLEGARAEASKVIIFFTDGQPTSTNLFEDGVANTAIAKAKDMKSTGTALYSVGIFAGADSGMDVSQVDGSSPLELKSNAFMQGLSTNYPQANSYTDLGRRSLDSNYYLATDDADALNEVFRTIWDEVSSKPSSPIQQETVGGTTAGSPRAVIRFTDQLGDYMKVLGMNSIVFAGRRFTESSAVRSEDGTTTTYTFSGSVEANEIYKAADLSRMTITVKSFDGDGAIARKGDLVTVEVPEELLPLRLYSATVHPEGNVKTDIKRTHPMRLFYEVGLKDISRQLTNPDAELASYIDGNKGVTATCEQRDAGGPGWSVDDGPVRVSTVKSGGMETLPYVNRYALDPVTLEHPSVSGTKTLEGRDWRADDAFTFTIKAGTANPAAALPEQTSVTLRGTYDEHEAVPFSFGAITFTTPGTYRYVIEETVAEDARKPGIRYSGARYVLSVLVEDDGQGELRIAQTAMTNTFDQNGDHITAEPVVYNGAEFINVFSGDNEAFADIEGYKHYEDRTGSNPNDTVGKFKVSVVADGGNPVPGPELGPDGAATVDVGLDGTWSHALRFTNEMLDHQQGRQFVFRVSEVVPDGVTADNPTSGGMTYDLTTHKVVVTLKRDADENLIATVSYPDGGSGIRFENHYEAVPAQAPLGAAKKVTGGSADPGRFAFAATLASGDEHVRIGEAPWANPMTVASPAIGDGETKPVDFGEVTFTKPGTYRFTVTEQTPPQSDEVSPEAKNPTIKGWTYDTHEHIVTVTVEDTGGVLTATATADDATSTFENSYAVAPLDYGEVGALRISKTLTGRSLRAGEFAFGITPHDGAPLPDDAQETSNPYAAAAGQASIWPVNGTLLSDLTFTKADAGKRYCYGISELVPKAALPGPDGALALDGVTYDTGEHTACLAVTDTGEGTLAVHTTVDGADTTVAAFVNRYDIAPATHALTFRKSLTGRDWKEGGASPSPSRPMSGGRR